MTLERVPRGIFAVHDATFDVLDLRARQGRFELTGVDVEMERHGDRIDLRGQVDLPEHLGSSIEFEGDAEGELADFATVAWRLRADANELDFEQWAALLPDSFVVPAAGHGDLGFLAARHRPRGDGAAAAAAARKPAPGRRRRRVLAHRGRLAPAARGRERHAAGQCLRAVPHAARPGGRPASMRC